MNWKNLQSNNCPKCGKMLTFTAKRDFIRCNLQCKFVISAQRMQEIVSSLNSRPYEPTYRSEQESLEALNNLGTEETEIEEPREDY